MEDKKKFKRSLNVTTAATHGSCHTGPAGPKGAPIAAATISTGTRKTGALTGIAGVGAIPRRKVKKYRKHEAQNRYEEK